MPNLSERLFYGNRRQQLAAMLGLTDLDEIRAKNSVTIPEVIFERSKADLASTTVDTRERLAEFDSRDGQIQVTRAVVGPKLAATNDGLKGRIPAANLYARHYKVFLGRAVPVTMHTHPSLTQEWWQTEGIDTISGGLRFEQASVLFREIGGFLSGSDLVYMSKRRVLSMLLATESGYTWVINPNVVGFPGTIRPALTYERYLQQASDTRATRMQQSGTAIVDDQWLKRFLFGKLYDFCYEKGFVGFYNRDKNSPRLETLRYLPY